MYEYDIIILNKLKNEISKRFVYFMEDSNSTTAVELKHVINQWLSVYLGDDEKRKKFQL